VYGLRSTSVHGGVVHGIEMFGNMLILLIGPKDPVYRFVFDTVRRMNRVARSLVLRLLAA
jgi:hypothetical protein